MDHNNQLGVEELQRILQDNDLIAAVKRLQDSIQGRKSRIQQFLKLQQDLEEAPALLNRRLADLQAALEAETALNEELRTRRTQKNKQREILCAETRKEYEIVVHNATDAHSVVEQKQQELATAEAQRLADKLNRIKDQYGMRLVHAVVSAVPVDVTRVRQNIKGGSEAWDVVNAVLNTINEPHVPLQQRFPKSSTNEPRMEPKFAS